MKFPKDAVDSIARQGHDEETRLDPHDADMLAEYAEWANVRIKELEEQCASLMFKVRCVAQALK
jgi:hypothetical protein